MTLCLTFCGPAASDFNGAVLVSIAISPSPAVLYLV